MKAIEIADGVYRVAANIGSKDLFEGIWPIPDGVSINSYLVKGEKTALIDIVKDWDNALEQVNEQLADAGSSVESIDYLILNHMEPDHTGWLSELKAKNPDVKIYCSKKSVPLIKAFYKIEDNVFPVGSGDSLDLGGGKILTFEDAPNVHWPETMVTFETSTGVLFSCDAFGAFGQVTEHVFDDQLTEDEVVFHENETRRYYSNIVSTFSGFVLKAIDKLSGLDIKVVAPSHGVIYRKNPGKIIEHYRRLASYHNGPAEKEITFIWSSMYGNTEKLVEPIIKAVEEEGVKINVHRVPQEHVSFVLSDAWKSAGLIFGMPTYEYRMFPPMSYVLDIFDRSHVKFRKIFRFGSFGWSGGAQKQFQEMTEGLKWECIEPVEWQGSADEETVARAVEQAKMLAREIKSL
ncbi:MAG: FprA family A-type flavoprotein [Spirochaetales bacterium]|uniref:FprA family A-type flavoprotein n=1 Tax=Candidatus Thalassospirochaeta sargassi TaxID=3119039 RepID=A0AAJ1IBF8_9SPIO|nr:FprA family A-type flavoprotein [Spirochaetales bacterium]